MFDEMIQIKFHMIVISYTENAFTLESSDNIL